MCRGGTPRAATELAAASALGRVPVRAHGPPRFDHAAVPDIVISLGGHRFPKCSTASIRRLGKPESLSLRQSMLAASAYKFGCGHRAAGPHRPVTVLMGADFMQPLFRRRLA
jgi:hypothetical protein